MHQQRAGFRHAMRLTQQATCQRKLPTSQHITAGKTRLEGCKAKLLKSSFVYCNIITKILASKLAL